MNNRQYPESDPRHHLYKIQSKLEEIMNHAREDVSKVTDPRAQVLFETTADVLGGLVKAYSDFDQESETTSR